MYTREEKRLPRILHRRRGAGDSSSSKHPRKDAYTVAYDCNPSRAIGLVGAQMGEDVLVDKVQVAEQK